MQILFVGGFHVADGDAEAGHEGEFLLHGIRAVKFIVAVRAVGPGLADQVTAVGGRVDQDVLGFGLETALYHCLEVFVLDLELLKGEVIHVDNKPVVAVFDLGEDPLQIAEFMFVDLDHAKTAVVILVEDSLDAGGFARAGIAVEQDIVGGASADKRLGIGNQFFLLQFIADQIIEHHVARRRDGNEEVILSRSRVVHRSCGTARGRHSRAGGRRNCRSRGRSLAGDIDRIAPSLVDAESLVKAEHSHAVIPVKIRHGSVHIILVSCLLEFLAQRLHLLGDAVVIDSLFFADRVIVLDHGKDVHVQRLFQRGKIIIKQLFEHAQVIFYKVIDRALVGPCLLGDQRKGGLCHSEQKGQIVVPQVFVESVAGRQIQQSVDLVQNTAGECLLVIHSAVKLPADL